MRDELSEAKKAIRIVPFSRCPHCGTHNEYPYHITSIESGEEDWIVHGKGSYNSEIDIRCSHCAAIYRTIAHTIPILCAPFPCPKCGNLQNLDYNICSIKTYKDSFEFEVKIECKKCKKKISFTKVIEKVLEVVRIEVNATGISVRKA
ncbi:MAG: hypothetical protein KAT65_15465 [Methanophagales archaeon]|nr:hypothetical protein [Methanophagales archaeon]